MGWAEAVNRATVIGPLADAGRVGAASMQDAAKRLSLGRRAPQNSVTACRDQFAVAVDVLFLRRDARVADQTADGGVLEDPFLQTWKLSHVAAY
jgi:hypothetical protein